MSRQRWRIDISAFGPDEKWRDIASGTWEAGSQVAIPSEAIPREIQEAFQRFEPGADESGFWDVQVGKVLYRIMYREA